MSNPQLTDSLRQEYQQLFDACQVAPQHLADFDGSIAVIRMNQVRYQDVGTPLGIPWYFIAAIHFMESSLNFKCHLHNGDPLTAPTVHDPAGRPPGNPPFTWEESATDALTYEGLDKVTDWTLTGTLYRLEAYNGFGYRDVDPPIHTPYLWSWSNQYTSGKYVSDHVYDPGKVSEQGGAAVLLRRMADQNILSIDASGTVTSAAAPDPNAVLLALAAQVTYSFSQRSAAAKALQQALNSLPGISLTADGVPGPGTSAALQSVSGQYLSGDPRGQTQTAAGD
jgi:lysozyme family protein